MADESYFRKAATHLDGSLIFNTPEDKANEDAVAAILEPQWNCTLHRFGALSPIDWWAQRAGRTVGLVELKCRKYAKHDHENVFLNVRKWLALTLAAAGMGTPAIFAVKFKDGLFWVEVARIDASKVAVGGLPRPNRSVSEIEPMILIPLELFHDATPEPFPSADL